MEVRAMRQRIVQCVLVAAALMAPAVASAESILFTGVVTFVSPELAGIFHPNQILSGSYRFASTMPDISPSPDVGIYEPLSALDVTFGGYTATLESRGRIFVENDQRCCPLRDTYRVEGFMSGPVLAGFVPSQFNFTLRDPTATVFAGDSLPLIPPDLTRFTDNGWGFFFDNGVPAVQGRITSLTVPEPGILFLVGFGLTSLAGYRRKQRRNRRRTLSEEEGR